MTKIQLPAFYVYCEGTNGHNALVFDLGPLRVWFSYRTPVAFKFDRFPLIVRENDWSVTTGKHLNAIDPDKKSRVSGKVFEELLDLVQNGRLVKLRHRLVEIGKLSVDDRGYTCAGCDPDEEHPDIDYCAECKETPGMIGDVVREGEILGVQWAVTEEADGIFSAWVEGEHVYDESRLYEATRIAMDVAAAAPVVHLLKSRGDTACGAKGPADSDINFITCGDCEQVHDDFLRMHEDRS